MEKMNQLDLMCRSSVFARDLEKSIEHLKGDEEANPVLGSLIALCYVLRDEAVANAAVEYMAKNPISGSAGAVLDVAAIVACRLIGVTRVRADGEDKPGGTSEDDFPVEGNA